MEGIRMIDALTKIIEFVTNRFNQNGLKGWLLFREKYSKYNFSC